MGECFETHVLQLAAYRHLPPVCSVCVRRCIWPTRKSGDRTLTPCCGKVTPEPGVQGFTGVCTKHEPHMRRYLNDPAILAHISGYRGVLENIRGETREPNKKERDTAYQFIDYIVGLERGRHMARETTLYLMTRDTLDERAAEVLPVAYAMHDKLIQERPTLSQHMRRLPRALPPLESTVINEDIFGPAMAPVRPQPQHVEAPAQPQYLQYQAQSYATQAPPPQQSPMYLAAPAPSYQQAHAPVQQQAPVYMPYATTPAPQQPQVYVPPTPQASAYAAPVQPVHQQQQFVPAPAQAQVPHQRQSEMAALQDFYAKEREQSVSAHMQHARSNVSGGAAIPAQQQMFSPQRTADSAVSGPMGSPMTRPTPVRGVPYYHTDMDRQLQRFYGLDPSPTPPPGFATRDVITGVVRPRADAAVEGGGESGDDVRSAQRQRVE